MALPLIAALTAPLAAQTRVAALEIPVVLDERELGQIPAEVGAEGILVDVNARAFEDLLVPYLTPERRAALDERADPAGKLSPEAIRACGIGFAFDPARVEARLSIPVATRPALPLDLRRVRRRDSEAMAPPAAFSGYVNALAGREYGSGDPSAPDGWRPPVLDLDAAARGWDMVLEGVATYRGQRDAPWQRQDVRAVRDWPDRRVRASVGDVNYGIRDFQAFQHMGGVAVTREFTMERSRASAPASSTELLLERASRVDVWINGQRYQTLQLPPGRYDVRNFPLVLGTNDVTLRITDEVGREETVRFPFVFDSSLLDDGEQDFSYAAGFLSRVTPQGRSYDANAPAFSGFHSFGVSDQLTVSGTAQGSRRQQMAGAEARWATRLGTLRADLAASRADFAPAGGAARLQYRYADTAARDSVRSWTAVATARTPTFTALGDEPPSNPYKTELGLVYGQRLPRDVFATLSLGRQLARGGRPEGMSADVTLSRTLARGLAGSVTVGRRRPAPGGAEDRVLASLTWTFGGARDMVTASQDSAPGSARLQWHHAPERRVRAAETNVLLGRDRLLQSAQGELHYRDYRFTAELSGSAAEDRTDGARQRRAGATLGTALAFVDGRAAITRPITDSFAVVTRHPDLPDEKIEVNAQSGFPAAASGPLGPAVLPELLSYDVRRVDVSAPGLPPWIDLGPQPLYVKPPYRSGTLIVAGTGAAVIVHGALADRGGRPLESEAGDIAAADRTAAPIGFFTGRGGRFAAEGLRPGRYRLTLRNFPENPAAFEILSKSAGIVDVGTLVIGAETEEPAVRPAQSSRAEPVSAEGVPAAAIVPAPPAVSSTSAAHPRPSSTAARAPVSIQAKIRRAPAASRRPGAAPRERRPPLTLWWLLLALLAAVIARRTRPPKD